MKSKLSDEQEVHEATKALKGLLGLGGGGGDIVNQGNLNSTHHNRDTTSPTTPNGGTATTVTTPATCDESDVNGKMNEKVEERDTAHNKPKKKKTNKKKKSPSTSTAADGSANNGGGTGNSITTTPPNANVRNNEKNHKTNDTNVNSNSKKNDTPSNSNQKNHTTSNSKNSSNNNTNKSNANVPKQNNTTSKKQNDSKAGGSHKKESENYAWSAFQSSPDPTNLPIPSFLSPPTVGPTSRNTASPNMIKDNNHSTTTSNSDYSSFPTTNSPNPSTGNTVVVSGTTTETDYLTMTSPNVEAVSSPQRNDIEPSHTEAENETHVIRNGRNDSENDEPVSLTTLKAPDEEHVHHETGVNLAAALAASRPTDTVENHGTNPTSSSSSFISHPNSSMPYPMIPSMYPNNFGPPPPSQLAPPYQRYPMPHPHHPSYRNVVGGPQPPPPHHLTNPYPLPHGPQPPNMHVPHNPYASPPGYITIQVQVPPNLIMPGRTMIVQSPAGYPVQIAVPDGVLPGMIIPVHVPIGPPLHMMPPPPPQQQQQQPMLHQLPPQNLQLQQGPYTTNRN